MKWDTIIQRKESELAEYFGGRSRGVEFSEPARPLKELIVEGLEKPYFVWHSPKQENEEFE